MIYYLYILKSLNRNFLYTGVTNNLEKRIKEHNLGLSKSTKNCGPFQLAYVKKFITLSAARKAEWELKCTPWGGKLKKKLARVGP